MFIRLIPPGRIPEEWCICLLKANGHNVHPCGCCDTGTALPLLKEQHQIEPGPSPDSVAKSQQFWIRGVKPWTNMNWTIFARTQNTKVSNESHIAYKSSAPAVVKLNPVVRFQTWLSIVEICLSYSTTTPPQPQICHLGAAQIDAISAEVLGSHWIKEKIMGSIFLYYKWYYALFVCLLPSTNKRRT